MDIRTHPVVMSHRGRRNWRMFPHIIVAIKGLDPEERYSVAMEILDADNRRYKYVKNQWMAMGTADPGPARHVYVHPDSPNSGAVWTKNCVSFAKVRLTNNKESKESILINSMHKYMVAVTIKEEAYNGDVMRFNFPETGFIAVTAYQNNAITQLKIKNNPFAKAFRDEAVSSKRSGHMEELRVIGNRNRNTCNVKRAQKVTAPWEEQFRVRQLRMHDMIEQGVKSCSQPLCELNVPSGVGFGCYGGPSSLYNWPWISNIGYSYPLPTMMAMWHHDRQYYSAGPGPPTQESPSISPRSGQSSSPTFSNDQSLNSNSTMD